MKGKKGTCYPCGIRDPFSNEMLQKLRRGSTTPRYIRIEPPPAKEENPMKKDDSRNKRDREDPEIRPFIA
jgi:hypothetical protein